MVYQKEKKKRERLISFFVVGRKYLLINTMPVQVFYVSFLKTFSSFCDIIFVIDFESYEDQHSVSSDVLQSLLFFQILTCYLALGILFYTVRLKYLISC